MVDRRSIHAAVLAGLCHACDLEGLAIVAIVLAMGLENAVFQIEGGSGLGLTYVTGALVKVGQLWAASLTDGKRFGWVPNLLLWAALVAGSAGGALIYYRIGPCRDLVGRRCGVRLGRVACG